MEYTTSPVYAYIYTGSVDYTDLCLVDSSVSELSMDKLYKRISPDDQHQPSTVQMMPSNSTSNTTTSASYSKLANMTDKVALM